jgi:hypothetical protein
MYIDKVDIYKFGRVYTKKKKLELKNHLKNEEMMKVSRLESLINTLKESWDCNYADVQVQIRFVPQGTEMDQQ